ncbi:hypothetical protein [Cupriavidus consociatus]|uniref:hypothetical protein n=1 Tax=Cupriavidus consociatus TaxID=2821357 RepID=UPI001AE3CCA4|nr:MULTISPECIES: hypothetical protein [unclassified Cupriavidus]MBP0618894.1 hypothetical protein [Cupriavidus sp. LEh25]MDK2655537.1 hypothetical protein [Cupriavidus sp. LEh21]
MQTIWRVANEAATGAPASAGRYPGRHPWEAQAEEQGAPAVASNPDNPNVATVTMRTQRCGRPGVTATFSTPSS